MIVILYCIVSDTLLCRCIWDCVLYDCSKYETACPLFSLYQNQRLRFVPLYLKCSISLNSRYSFVSLFESVLRVSLSETVFCVVHFETVLNISVSEIVLWISVSEVMLWTSVSEKVFCIWYCVLCCSDWDCVAFLYLRSCIVSLYLRLFCIPVSETVFFSLYLIRPDITAKVDWA